MKYGADHGLDDIQIEQRNQLIDDIQTGLRNFNETYALELPLGQFEGPSNPAFLLTW